MIYKNRNCCNCSMLSSSGHCRLTACINPLPTRTNDYVPKPKTNGDRVRAMTDEELAKMLDGSICPPGYNQIGACEAGEEECYLCWLDWVKGDAT